MKDSERVFRLTRRDKRTYWSGPYDHADQFSYSLATGAPLPEEEVRHLSIADAFDAAGPGKDAGRELRRFWTDEILDEGGRVNALVEAVRDVVVEMVAPASYGRFGESLEIQHATASKLRTAFAALEERTEEG
jgi:hypothetical protein